LIELMIVVAIIGILASLAIPAYLQYTVRARITEGVLAASAAKIPIAEYFAMLGELPPGGDNEAAGINENHSSPYIASVDWHEGQRIEIEFDEDALGITGQVEIGLAPQIVNNVIRWQCGQDSNTSDENLKYVPTNCRERLW
jgi:type IV pilus assembly protein PilA